MTVTSEEIDNYLRQFDNFDGMLIQREAWQEYMREFQSKLSGELAESEPDTHDEWREMNDG